MKQEREPQAQQRQPSDWLQECLDTSHRIHDALLRNDLAALEGCLDLEGILLSQRPTLRVQDLAMPRSIAREIRSTNDRNRALINNGIEFARTMLDVIRPPATYSPVGSITLRADSDGSLISVKG